LVGFGRIWAENRKTDKNRGLLIWTRFRPSTSSVCSGSGHTGDGYSGSVLTGYIETLLLHLKFHWSKKYYSSNSSIFRTHYNKWYNKNDEMQLFCFKFVNPTTIIDSRWEVKININLEYYLSHLLYQPITSINL
jgi:hypothetical protein